MSNIRVRNSITKYSEIKEYEDVKWSVGGNGTLTISGIYDDPAYELKYGFKPSRFLITYSSNGWLTVEEFTPKPKFEPVDEIPAEILVEATGIIDVDAKETIMNPYYNEPDSQTASREFQEVLETL